VYVLASALAVLGTIGAIGGAVLGGLVLTFVAMAFATAKAGEGTAAAFKEMTKFVEAGGKITKIASVLDKLGAAFKKLNSATQGGGLLQKGLRFIGVGGAPKQSPIAKMVQDMKPLLDGADKLGAVFAGISKVFELSEIGVGSTFVAMAAGLEDIYSVIDNSTEKGVQITHTLENLALITRGKSASSSATGGIIKALNNMNREIKLQLQLDPTSTKKLLEGEAINTIGTLV